MRQVLKDAGAEVQKVFKEDAVLKRMLVPKVEIVEEKDLELVDWSRFEDIEVLEDGVCGLKVCCIRAKIEGGM